MSSPRPASSPVAMAGGVKTPDCLIGGIKAHKMLNGLAMITGTSSVELDRFPHLMSWINRQSRSAAHRVLRVNHDAVALRPCSAGHGGTERWPPPGSRGAPEQCESSSPARLQTRSAHSQQCQQKMQQQALRKKGTRPCMVRPYSAAFSSLQRSGSLAEQRAGAHAGNNDALGIRPRPATAGGEQQLTKIHQRGSARRPRSSATGPMPLMVGVARQGTAASSTVSAPLGSALTLPPWLQARAPLPERLAFVPQGSRSDQLLSISTVSHGNCATDAARSTTQQANLLNASLGDDEMLQVAGSGNTAASRCGWVPRCNHAACQALFRLPQPDGSAALSRAGLRTLAASVCCCLSQAGAPLDAKLLTAAANKTMPAAMPLQQTAAITQKPALLHQSLTAELEVWDHVLAELCRTALVECAERGTLLSTACGRLRAMLMSALANERAAVENAAVAEAAAEAATARAVAAQAAIDDAQHRASTARAAVAARDAELAAMREALTAAQGRLRRGRYDEIVSEVGAAIAVVEARELEREAAARIAADTWRARLLAAVERLAGAEVAAEAEAAAAADADTGASKKAQYVCT